MKWKEKFKEQMKGGGEFIRLKNGEEVTGIFRGEPVIFFKAYEPETKTTITKKEYFEYGGKSASKRFRLCFIVKEGENHVCKIFEGSKTSGEALSMIMDEYDITNTVFKIKRDGDKMDTVYHFLAKDKLTPEQVKKIDAIELLDMEPMESGEDQAEFPTSMDEVKKKAVPF